MNLGRSDQVKQADHRHLAERIRGYDMGTNVEQQSFTVIENGTIVTPGGFTAGGLHCGLKKLLVMTSERSDVMYRYSCCCIYNECVSGRATQSNARKLEQRTTSGCYR